MLLAFSDTLQAMPHAPGVVLSLALMLFGGFAMTRLFTGDRAAWDKLAQQDMREDFSWRVPAKAYRALFASLHED